MRVGVNGAAGQMGQAVCDAVAGADDLDLVAAVDPGGVGLAVGGEDGSPIVVAEELHAFADADCDLVVDFTNIAAARTSIPWLGMHGIHAVVGTSGFSDDEVAQYRSIFDPQDAPNCLIAPNFAISAVLMMRFAELAAPWFDTAEVVELHHTRKIDAPSGTAVATVERMAAARDTDFLDDPTQHEVYPGARGGAGPRNVRAHAVRMHGMVAHQEVILGAVGQTLTVRQDSFDRSSFMPGVLLACRRIGELPGLTIGLDPLLDI